MLYIRNVSSLLFEGRYSWTDADWPINDDAEPLSVVAASLEDSERVHLSGTCQSSVAARTDLDQLACRVNEQPVPAAVSRHHRLTSSILTCMQYVADLALHLHSQSDWIKGMQRWHLCVLTITGERCIVTAISVSVCLFATCPHVQTLPNFLCMLPVAMARSSLL